METWIGSDPTAVRAEVEELERFIKSLAQQQQEPDTLRANPKEILKRIGLEVEFNFATIQGEPAVNGQQVIAELVERNSHVAFEFASHCGEISTEPFVLGEINLLLEQLKSRMGAVENQARRHGLLMLGSGLLPSVFEAALFDPEIVTKPEHKPRYEAVTNVLRSAFGGFAIELKGVNGKGSLQLNLPHAPIASGMCCQHSPNVEWNWGVLGAMANWGVVVNALSYFLSTSPFAFGQASGWMRRPEIWSKGMCPPDAAFQVAPYDIGDYYIEDGLCAVLQWNNFAVNGPIVIPFGNNGKKSFATPFPILDHIWGTRWICADRFRMSIQGNSATVRNEDRFADKALSIGDDVAYFLFRLGLRIGLFLLYDHPREVMSHEEAMRNMQQMFISGPNARLTWEGVRYESLREFLLEQKIRGGHTIFEVVDHALSSVGIPDKLRVGAIQEVHRQIADNDTGADWMLQKFATLNQRMDQPAALRALVTQLPERGNHIWF